MKFKFFLYTIKRKVVTVWEKTFSTFRLLRLIKILRPKDTNKKLIRLGGDSDGGYLVPDDLNGVKTCFSAGIGDISDFEYSCAEIGMEVFMADASVDAPVLNDIRFNFEKKFIGNKNLGNFITLEEWIKISKVDLSSDFLLQMDIEGNEYDVLNSSSFATLKKFRILVIEFHNLHKLSDSEFHKKANSAFKKILKNHVCIHIHPNNCCGIRKINGIEIPVVAEFTFIRRDRIQINGNVRKFPHEHDRDNVNNPSITLPDIWFKKI